MFTFKIETQTTRGRWMRKVAQHLMQGLPLKTEEQKATAAFLTYTALREVLEGNEHGKLLLEGTDQEWAQPAFEMAEQLRGVGDEPPVHYKKMAYILANRVVTGKKVLNPLGDLVEQWKSGQAFTNTHGQDDFGREALRLMTVEQLAECVEYEKEKSADGMSSPNLAMLEQMLALREMGLEPSGTWKDQAPLKAKTEGTTYDEALEALKAEYKAEHQPSFGSPVVQGPWSPGSTEEFEDALEDDEL